MATIDIVIDSSAIVALLIKETDGRIFADRIARSRRSVISAANFVECGIVLEHRGVDEAAAKLNELFEILRIDIEQLDAEQATAAIAAFTRFGRGRHPAKLNFGDCFAYALAKTKNAPLLFKGDDFARTDVKPAL